jgi:Uncharacterised protein family (UPF0175)
VIGYTRFHRGRHAQRAVNLAEVVISEVKRNSGLVRSGGTRIVAAVKIFENHHGSTSSQFLGSVRRCAGHYRFIQRKPYSDGMTVTVQIPDDLAQHMGVEGGDLSRHGLEVLALEEYKSGHLSKPELRRVLGFATLPALDGFLRAHGVFEEYTLDDLEQERQDLRRLGF